jgi:predicted metal-binding membrane protein
MSCRISKSNGDPRSALRAGLDSGVCCVTCCSGPTLLLLALGMMNPAVIVLVAAMIALEKLMPKADRILHLSGVLALLAGAMIIGRLVF